MSITGPIARYCISIACAVACAGAIAMRPPQQEISMPGSAASSSTYLDCAHIAGLVLEPDLITDCSMVAGLPPQRDFDGDPVTPVGFERRLETVSPPYTPNVAASNPPPA